MKKDTLDIKLEEILDELCSWESEGMTDSEYQSYKDKARTQLKALIKSTLLDALPKEKEQTGTKYDNQKVFEESISYYVKGWNACLKDIKDSLEGVGE